MRYLLCIGAIFLLLERADVAPLRAQSLVSLNVRDADVVETLRTLADLGGLNVLISPDVQGTVTLRLEGVPVEDALEILIKITGLARVRKGSVIGILPRKALLEHQKQLAEARALGLGEFRTEVVRLNYARATELARILAPLLSPWGAITADERTNSLIIRDVPESSIFHQTQSAPIKTRP